MTGGSVIRCFSIGSRQSATGSRRSAIGNRQSAIGTPAMRNFKRILVHADTTAVAQPALDRAAALARHVGADLMIVDVAGALPRHARRLLPETLRARLESDRATRLAALATDVEAGAARGVRVATSALTGR